MAEVLPEAHQLVDEGLLSEEDFRDFVFGNSVRLWASTNPNFFKGTAIEKQVADYLHAVHTEKKTTGVNSGDAATLFSS